ncbi:MAG TPA: hypothetical protein VNG51_05985 [Ktedonobacteraceae bacterium]|nr:hypothetical protein [Ktedonobacteraceae bacterium]
MNLTDYTLDRYDILESIATLDTNGLPFVLALACVTAQASTTNGLPLLQQ